MTRSIRFCAALVSVLFLISSISPAARADDDSNGPGNVRQSETRNSINSAIMAAVGPDRQMDEPRITLELKGVDILDVLKIISQRSELNIVAGKNVRGLVTLYLKNVKVRDALDTIVNSLELAYVEDSGIINVMTSKEFEDAYGKSFGKEYTTKAIPVQHASPAAVGLVVEKLKSPKGKMVFDERTHTLILSDRQENIAAMENAMAQLDKPLATEVFQLKFARGDELEAQLRDYLTPQTGILKVDKRTSQITVTDREEKLEQVREVIKALDVQPRQVLIQAQVIEVALFDAFRYGIDWEFVRQNVAKFSNVELKPAFDVAVPTAALGAGTLSTFTFGGLQGLSVVLSFLQNVGKTNTLSSPRITVINNEEAKLVDATRQPYVSQTVVQGQTTSQTADNIQFVDVGVTLTVVPTIADREKVVLKLKPEVSSQTGSLSVQSVSEGSDTPFTRSQIPIVSSQTLETTVVVKSGETLIVGGLIKDNEAKIRRKLPVLSDIPFLGAAFRSEQVSYQKTELVIFLTPYIVDGDATSKEHSKYFNEDDQLINFDLVGGYDFGKALKHSQGAFRIDHDPYWKMRSNKMPQYFAPKDLYERALPYENSLNEFNSYQEGKPLVDPDAAGKRYEIEVARETQARLAAAGVEGRVEVAVKVGKDGTIRDISWVDPGPVREADQRRVLRAVQDGGPFAAFPEGLASEEELLSLRLAVDRGDARKK
ncbi:MAG TPA: secretin N-terminal domain-containing protein [Verrucomicrobiae bacterium]|nr:secretin N-terminal domain-containing protein [Verrucomicrobiae bacterium]